ncbi:MAG: sulfite exporter TauE/SafE family protein [Chloroflexi bacterium]|nr:sulfite exporter TauE/SafE family protein [Chloroflexota bacterium]
MAASAIDRTKAPPILGFVLLGLVGGLLSGFFGIGGGVVFVPSMVAVFAIKQQRAQGTSLAIIIPTALLGLVTYSLHHPLRWGIALPMMVGAVLFAFLGATVAARVPATFLKVLFFILIVFSAVRLFLT